MKCNILAIFILSSYFNNDATIKINQFLERKLMVSHKSLIRQGFKWYLCKLNMPLLNAPTKISTQNRFFGSKSGMTAKNAIYLLKVVDFLLF